MSLYEGRECPECDGPTELRGQLCKACETKHVMQPHFDAAFADMQERKERIKAADMSRELDRAKMVRGALLGLAAEVDPGRNVTSDQVADRELALALATLANANEQFLAKLGRLMK